MNMDEMVSAVRESARIDTREHAEKAIRATLAVLGQRLAGEAADLAAQLPDELTVDMPTGPEAERFRAGGVLSQGRREGRSRLHRGGGPAARPSGSGPAAGVSGCGVAARAGPAAG